MSARPAAAATLLAHPPAQVEAPEAVAAWMNRARSVAVGERIFEGGGTSDVRVHFVRSGWLEQSRFLKNGRRQILSLFLPGDAVLPPGSLSRSADVVTALSVGAVASVPVEEVEAARAHNPDLDAWFAWAAQRRCAMLEEQVVSLGQRKALERTGHLLCELLARSGDGPQAPAPMCEMPLTQADLADTVGLSVVHMNRVLQALRRASLVEMSRGRLRVIDFGALAKASGFDGAYLA